MKTKLLTSMLIVIAFVCVLAFSVSAATTTVTIGTADEFMKLMNEEYAINDSTYVFKLTADINLSGKTGQTPIGTSTKKFKGTFDGDGHTVSGINITSSGDEKTYPYLGLFGLCEGATIENVTVKGTVNGTVPGESSNSNIDDKLYVAGLVAWARGITIDNCHSYINVTNASTGATDDTCAGGILGYASFTDADLTVSITNCTNHGTINAYQYTGGILGITSADSSANQTLKIEGCENYGDITITTGNVTGGIVGYYRCRATKAGCSLALVKCANYGNITATKGGWVSGIIGAALESIDKSAYASKIEIRICMNAGELSGTGNVGAVAGAIRAVLADGGSYDLRRWINLDTTAAHPLVGGFGAVTSGVTNTSATITAAYNASSDKVYGSPGNNTINADTANYVYGASNAAEAAAELVKKYGTDNWVNVCGTPALADFATISTADELVDLMNNPKKWSASYLVTANIDLSKYTGNLSQKPIGNLTTPFTGKFDGGGHTISGIAISGTSHGTGFFGVTRGATIANLTASGTVTSSVGLCGGVIGIAFAPITADNVANNIAVTHTGSSNGNYIGGVIGAVYFDESNVDAKITNVTNKADIVGGAYVGGIIGEIQSENAVDGSTANVDVQNHNITLTNAVNHGKVTANLGNVAGGVLGYFRYRSDGTSTFTANKCANYGEVYAEGDYAGGVLAAVLEGKNDDKYKPEITLKISELHNSGKVSSKKGEYNGAVIGNLRVPGTGAHAVSDLYNDNADATEYDVIGVASCAELYNASSFTLDRVYNRTGTKIIGSQGSGTTATQSNCFTSADSYDKTKALLNNAAWEDTTQGPMLKAFTAKNVLDNSIDSAIELILLMNSPDEWGKSYTVSTDINLADYTGSVEQSPIGTPTKAFTGSFDGQGHTISGVDIDYNTYGAGFFGVVSDNVSKPAEIKNFTLYGKVKTTERFAGAVVGLICGSAKISGITNYATISSTYTDVNAGRIGGIVGVITLNNYLSAIDNVENLAGINGEITVTVENCINRADITGIADDANDADKGVYVSYNQGRLGGIVGSISPTHAQTGSAERGASIITVRNCENYGAITAEGTVVGGIVGKLESGGNPGNKLLVTKCYNEGKITSNFTGTTSLWNGAYVGGIVGYASFNTDTVDGAYVNPCTSMEISYNHNVGEVTAPNAYLIGTKNYEVLPESDEEHEDGTVDEGGAAAAAETTENTVSSYFQRNAQIGGIVGYAFDGEAASHKEVYIMIKNNLNEGHVYARGNDIGGIVGIANPAHIHDNHNKGIVESTLNETVDGVNGKYIGGIIGRINDQSSCSFKRNYSSGELVGNADRILGIGGGYDNYSSKNIYVNNYYSGVETVKDINSDYVSISTPDKVLAYTSADITAIANKFPGLNGEDQWTFTLEGPELTYFHGEHTYDYKGESVAPTCTADGKYDTICRCGDVGTANAGTLDKLGHAWGDFADADGTNHSRSCGRCDATETGKHSYPSVDNHPYTEHGTTTWTKLDGTYHTRTCKTCEYVAKSEHTMEKVHVAAVPATCEGTGKTEVMMCDVCLNTAGGETVPATGHSYSESVWAEAGAGAYEFACHTCDKVAATADTPYVYVDANANGVVGDNKNVGVAPQSAVYSIEEAARRMANTGGKIILCDSYAVTDDITLPEYAIRITITGLVDDAIVGSFNVTGAPKIYLGGATVIDDITFTGSGKVGFVRYSNRNN